MAGSVKNQYNNPKKVVFSSFDTSFNNADSPVTLDLKTTLGRNSVDGYINNTGSNRFTFTTSEDGTNYDSAINLEPGLTFSLRALSINKIQITWVADTSYEVFAV